MVRAAIYLRQSQDANDDRLAVTRQLEDCTALCESRGWDIVATYTDNDRSASNGKPRPEYRKMLADIRAGQLDAVVVWDLDRLHRKPIELEEFITLADERQLALATVGGDTDLSTDGGRLFARIKGAVAKAEVERKSARQKRANQQQAALGKWLASGNRPFGYSRDGEPLEPEATAIRKAAADVLAGVSLRSIATAWNKRGLTTTLGSRWTNLQLRRVLTNPRIAALRVHQGRVIGAGDWPPILDEQTHHGLVAFLNDPSRRPAASFERKHQGSTIYRCGICGGPLYAAYPHGPGQRMTYLCRPTSHVARHGEPLDAYVEMLLFSYLSDPNTRKRLAALMVNGEKVDVGALHANRAAVDARLDELTDMFTSGQIDSPQYRRGTTDLRAQRASIDSQLAELARRSPAADLIAAGEDAEKRWAALSPDLKGKVIDELMTVTVNLAPRGRWFKNCDEPTPEEWERFGGYIDAQPKVAPNE